MENRRQPAFVVLNRRRDFLHLKKTGRRIKSQEWLLLNYKMNESGTTRVGWTIPKFVGGAVVRNRLKRWCREYLRNSSDIRKLKGVDINIVFRKMERDFYRSLRYSDFKKALGYVVAKLARVY